MDRQAIPPFPEDPIEAARQRSEEDKAIQKEMDALTSEMGRDPMDRLRARRKKLKSELNELDAELGEYRVDRTWLRKLPEWFWFPAYVTTEILGMQTACQKCQGRPTIYHWQRHADATSFGINLVLGLLYLSLLFSLLSMLV